MSEMVERVARALAMVSDYAVRTRSGPDYAERAWRSYEARARAAIEAMREPTAAMLREGDDWTMGDCPGLDEQYRAMIDAALKDPITG